MDHSHKHFHAMLGKRAPVPDLTTVNGQVMSVVYVTAEATFSGEIGGYTTLTDGGDIAATQASDNGVFTLGPPTSIDATSTPAASSGSDVSPSSNVFTSDAFTSSTLRTSATTSSRATNTGVAGAASTSDASSPSSSSSGSSGMTTGAKAGLAIGIIVIIGIIAAVLLWFLGKKRREKEAYSKADDEKSTIGATAKNNDDNTFNMTSTPTSAHAPRLSLRPMSSMLPALTGGSSNRRSAGNMLNTIGESGPAPGAARNMSPSPQPRNHSRLAQRQDAPPENPFADPQNPFADPEKASAPLPPSAHGPPPSDRFLPIQAPNSALAPAPLAPAPLAPIERKPAPINPLPSSAPSLPFSSPALVVAGAAGAAGAAAVGALAVGAAAASQRKQESPRENLREFARAPSPAPSTPVSIPPPAAARAAAPSPGSDTHPAGNVYRVLMDFAPSMDDELELKTGQLVRMLHEYDDGWALCIKLDRSHQGVVPRTCLAAKASKPKPSHLNQYARGPGGGGSGRSSPAMGRPMSPAGGPMGRPMSPAGGPPRPMSPAGGPRGRPMSPAGQRPMSAAGGPRRPMSPSNANGRMSPGPRGMGPPSRMGPNRPMSPGGFNQAPRPLSPGPRPGKRSQSPGPYGAAGPMPMATTQRRRSNSASALNVRDRRMTPPGPSKLGPGGPFRPMSPGIGSAI